MKRGHLSDEQLIEACLSVPEWGAQQHLLDCTTCGARRAAVKDMLAEISDVAAVEADAVFSPERLARQYAKILQRVDQDGRPARVIVFPAGQQPSSSLLRPRPVTRWVAGAAAAGLILGLLGGHLARTIAGFDRPAPTVVAQGAGPSAIRTVSLSAEDEFLGQIELAVGSAGPAVLRPIDALTPRAWDVR